METRQIIKFIANILTDHFTGTEIEVLTPKAGLTSHFRKAFNFQKNRDINDHHHAHDAYLTGIVANYVYKARPDLKNLWVYGEYQRQTNHAFKGKSQRREDDFFKQLLEGMEEKQWRNYVTGETFVEDRDVVLSNIEKTLNYRNVNLVKKVERQTGKFSKESIYSKGKDRIPMKKHLNPERYGGRTGEDSAFAVLKRDKKGNIKPETVSVMDANHYQKQASDVTVFKYTKYRLPNGVYRLMVSYQEAKNANQIKAFKIPNVESTAEEFEQAYEKLAVFIEENGLIGQEKLRIVKEKFIDCSTEEKLNVLKDLLKITSGSMRGLKFLKSCGGPEGIRLKTTKDRLSSGSTLIYQSPTGLLRNA